MKKIRRNDIIRRVTAIIMAVAMYLACTLPVFCTHAETRKIRIACNYNDFLRVDKSGNVTGHMASYMNEMSKINNWEYEYIDATWSLAVKMLEQGQVDLLFPTGYTEERKKTMDFSQMPIGYTATGLFAMQNSDIAYEDYDAMDGARIAITYNSTYIDDIKKFAAENNFSYTPIVSYSTSESIRALKKGNADLAVFNAADKFDEGVLVAVTETQPVYFTVKKGNKDMLDLIDHGMQSILQSSPEVVTDLMHNIMVGSNTSIIAFTDEERDFINSDIEIKVGFYEDTEPLAYVDKNGEYKGVYIDILKHMKEKSNLNMTLVSISRDKDWKDMLDNGDIDFYIGSSTVIAEEDGELNTTNAIMEYANVLITDDKCAFNSLSKPVVALTHGRAYWAEYLSSYIGKSMDIKYYTTTKECMEAVVRGEADATILNNLEFNYHSKNDRLANFIQWPQYRFNTKVGLTASADADPMMLSTINKVINMLTDDYVESVIEEYHTMPYMSYSIEDVLYNARMPLIVLAMIVVAVAIMLSISNFFRRQQESIKQAAVKKEHDHLELLAATSYDYSAIYYIDLDDNTSRLINQHTGLNKTSKVMDDAPVRNYTKALIFFTETYVVEEDQERILEYADPQKVINEFRTRDRFTVRYSIKPDYRNQQHFEMDFIKVARNIDGHYMMVLSIRCIDEIVLVERENQKRLSDALDGANRANAAKSDFLSRMSHDIRTPMNAIIGMTTIAQAHADDPERLNDSLEKISGASHHLLNLINDVLDMSKIESGSMSLTEEEINLGALIDNINSIMQPQMTDHNHEYTCDISGIKHHNVIGDSLRIRQAIINLLGNAVKYTPDGGKISMTVHEKDISATDATCYEFIFVDNGIGMSPEVQAQIFEPFVRAESSMISKIQGTGLGLPITRNTAQMMNGNIYVKSKEGEGSTFIMTLFLKLQDEKNSATDNIAAVSDKVDMIQQTNFSNKRVLLVEDNDLNREIAMEILGMTDITIETAVDGQEAVDMFSAAPIGHYDIILMDIQMPRMNGYEATQAIRALDREDAATVPILAMTANAFMEDIQAAKTAGMDEHIAKPIDFAKLNDALSKYLSNK